jgi:hypothetical protein
VKAIAYNRGNFHSPGLRFFLMPATPGFLASLWQGTRVALFLKPDPRRVDAGVATLCALFVFDVLLSVAAQWLQMGGNARFNWWGVSTLFVELPFLLLAGWVAARRSLMGITPLSLPVLAIAGGPAYSLLSLAVNWLGAGSPVVLQWFYLLVVIWWGLTLIVAYVRLVGRGAVRSGGGTLWIVVAAALYLLPHQTLLMPARDEAAPVYRASIEREDAFHAQATLLDEQLAALQPQRAGVEDLYFVGFAGYAAEDVFYKELQVIAPLLNQRFDTAGRSLLLVNNAQTVKTLPIASATHLRRALRGIASRINREEDVVMLYLTSHGSSNHEFSVSFWPLELEAITPATLKTMLDEAGIKWRVIVVSACYSGGYIGPLKDEQTLVMTAADATHTSFGCGSESDFTYFGRALFDEQLRNTRSFAYAFEQAKLTIRAREHEQGLEASNPQIAMGSLIADKLARMTARLDAAAPKKD